MKSGEFAESKTFVLSDSLSIEITVGSGGMTCEWDPDIPSKLTANELRNYLEARQEMVSRFAERIGGPVIVIET